MIVSRDECIEFVLKSVPSVGGVFMQEQTGGILLLLCDFNGEPLSPEVIEALGNRLKAELPIHIAVTIRPFKMRIEPKAGGALCVGVASAYDKAADAARDLGKRAGEETINVVSVKCPMCRARNLRDDGPFCRKCGWTLSRALRTA